MQLKSIVKLISLFLLVLVTNCAGTLEDFDLSTPRHQPYFVIMADEHIRPEHKQAIFDAVTEWQSKTNNTLDYDLRFIDMSEVPKTHTEHTIKIYIQDPGIGLVGWTNWRHSDQAAYMLIEPSMDQNTFRKIMLHELGHAFNVHFYNMPNYSGPYKNDAHYHGPYKSVLYPSIGDADEHLGCVDLIGFCEQWGCQVDCYFENKVTKLGG